MTGIRIVRGSPDDYPPIVTIQVAVDAGRDDVEAFARTEVADADVTVLLDAGGLDPDTVTEAMRPHVRAVTVYRQEPGPSVLA